MMFAFLAAIAIAALSKPSLGLAQNVSCGFGQVPMPVAATGKHLCTDGMNAFGPFPYAMRAECEALSQPFCGNPVWPVFYAMNLRGFDVCPKGSLPEPKTAYCTDGTNIFGPFSEDLRAKCRAWGGGAPCESNSYGRLFALDLLGLKPAPLLPPQPRPSNIDALVAEIRERKPTGSATFQDSESRGIFPAVAEADTRSEPIYLPFVLGPRRQVDQMVRQLYLLLPLNIRTETAFIVSDRFVQNPAAYVPYLKSRAQVVIVTSFVGIGNATNRNSDAYKYATWRHGEELWGLMKTIEAAKALGKPVSSVVLGMGDSTTDFGPTVRAEVQARVDDVLTKLDVAQVATPVSWGADELVAVAFARALPERGVKVWFSNPNARHTWDGRRTTLEIVNEKIRQTRLRVEDKSPDIWSVVLSRRPGQDDRYVENDAQQLAFDEALLRDFRPMPSSEANLTALIDGRSFNGAWNAQATLRRCDLLAYGSWGTFGNTVGQTLAQAKILQASGNAAARKQLLLEAVAHDVFSIGYAESQSSRLAALARAQGVVFQHYGGYDTAGTTATVFRALNGLVNQRMQEHYAGTGCMDGRTVRATAQLWRTFESEVHLWPQLPGEVFGAGVYRKSLPPDTFDPTAGRLSPFDLGKLVAEGCCG
ncbi:MAG: DUF4127 family protein [Silvanigrellales bacterium]|nr:DUF4127 family protein [Silvanigrellales bacterium]